MADSLHDTDYFAWTQEQARLLRDNLADRANEPLDWAHLAAKIESLGASDLPKLRSQLRCIIEHLPKLQFSPTEAPRRGWRDTIDNARLEIEVIVNASPSLRGKIALILPEEAMRATGSRPIASPSTTRRMPRRRRRPMAASMRSSRSSATGIHASPS